MRLQDAGVKAGRTGQKRVLGEEEGCGTRGYGLYVRRAAEGRRGYARRVGDEVEDEENPRMRW